MTVTIVSDREIPEALKTMVKCIMRQSQCPNETLINSIVDCKGLKDNIITIGNLPSYIDRVEY